MVPHDLATKKGFENAPVIDQGNWVFKEFIRPSILVPTTPHFTQIADIYYNEMKKLYGKDIKYFGGEPFHEGGKTKGIDVPIVAKNIQEQCY